MFDLTNKVAIVTGASRGIGKSIATALSHSGTHVVCVSRNINDIKSVAGSLPNASAFACDVSSADGFDKLVNSTVSEHGKIDILVNNAGITRDGLIMRMKTEDWNTVLTINLTGAFNGIKAVARPMIKQKSGRIINISSVVGLTGNAGQANYAASKAGLIGLTKATAKEFASRGITVNCIAPGYISTDMTNKLSDAVKKELIKQIPLGRIGNPDDIAHMVLYLSSEEAGYITGQTMTVDGGMVMT
ncbi:MAG: 3-oxoacyl-[acyl-carrier-protein] reductase [Candidatus Marinimicrobia bacterium]|nr:3-oxoacyl-[acyl-carrier-protein] reductase [Candidatus Neomarinimicrobiota bacterium]MCH7762510.1 3-oxoacyl-[acyl-carrier-protein] reductase [Candidatus Neomarinimicrobiota bacterium]